MKRFDDALLVDFLRRSYQTVDGLWFVKVEEEISRQLALKLDHAVWQVMPKIQGRKARELLGLTGGGLANLLKCQELKMAAEDYDAEVEIGEGSGRIIVKSCPWYEILKRTGRTELAEPIFELICKEEFGAWCREFGEGISHRIGPRICGGAQFCEVAFSESATEPGL